MGCARGRAFGKVTPPSVDGGSTDDSSNTIECTATSLEFDNTTQLDDADGRHFDYHLTFIINGGTPFKIIYGETFYWNTYEATPAFIFGTMLGNIFKEPSECWIDRPMDENWSGNIDWNMFYEPTVAFNGLAGSTPNTLTIVPSNEPYDLYPYLATNGEASLTIHSCGMLDLDSLYGLDSP